MESINVETDAQSIKDRKNLSINGYLEITLLVSNNGKNKKTNYFIQRHSRKRKC